jgi:hypothetical protein
MNGHQVHLNAVAYLTEMVDLIVGFTIYKYPSKFTNIRMWDRFFEAAKFAVPV